MRGPESSKVNYHLKSPLPSTTAPEAESLTHGLFTDILDTNIVHGKAALTYKENSFVHVCKAPGLLKETQTGKA